MTCLAGDISMRTGEGEWSVLVVIELRRFPARRVVAGGAIRRIFAFAKLAGVLIVMAAGTFRRSSMEIYVF
jgi:hypothetical protein